MHGEVQAGRAAGGLETQRRPRMSRVRVANFGVQSSEGLPAACLCLAFSPPPRPRYAALGEPRIQCVTLILRVIRQHQINRVNIAALQLFSQLHCKNLYLLASVLTQESILLQLVDFTLFSVYLVAVCGMKIA